MFFAEHSSQVSYCRVLSGLRKKNYSLGKFTVAANTEESLTEMQALKQEHLHKTSLETSVVS